MIIQEAELFKGLTNEVMTEISGVMVEESHNAGKVLFTQQDPAQFFYILLEGRVRLAIGTEAEIDYLVARQGEIFGWSSMVDRKNYTASAECLIPTTVAKVGKERLNTVFEKHPEEGVLFFKRLAGAIAQRLIDSYNTFLSEGSMKGITYGTEQVMEEEEL